MARRRMISSSLPGSERLHKARKIIAKTCPEHIWNIGWFFAMLITKADDFGRGNAGCWDIKNAIYFDPDFQVSDECIEAMLSALQESKLILWYEIEEKRYYEIKKFENEQPGLHKRTKSYFPEYVKNSDVSTLNENIPGNSGKVTGKRISYKDLGTLKDPSDLYVRTPSEPDAEKGKFSDDSPEIKLSSLLLEKILARNPNHKKPNLQSWAKDIDKMIRLDKRTPAEIEKVILWCQQDTFWQNNILSTGKLREKFDQLALKMRESPKTKPHEIGFAEPSKFEKGKGGFLTKEQILEKTKGWA